MSEDVAVVDPQRKRFFIHIPKCAGVSIFAATKGRCITDGHYTAAWYTQRYGADYDDGYVFTCVRHPYPRFVSAYSYLTQQTPEHKNWFSDAWEREYLLKYPTLEALVLQGGPDVLRIRLFWPQVTWFDHAKPMDKVLAFETLHATWPEFSVQHGFASSLPQLNASKHGLWFDVLSPAVRKHLELWYRSDFERFGYDA